jgi:hypothetical protein
MNFYQKQFRGYFQLRREMSNNEMIQKMVIRDDTHLLSGDKFSILEDAHMEKFLRLIGNVFLYYASAIHEAKDIADSYFFDILFGSANLEGRTRIYPRAHDQDIA